MEGARLSTGVADLDEELGGLIRGDNLVLVAEPAGAARAFEEAFLAEGARRQGTCVLVRTEARAGGLAATAGVDVLYARAGGEHADPVVLEQELVALGHEHPQAYILVESLDALARRWGQDRVASFYQRTSARLFDVGALAYWHATRDTVGEAALRRIRHVAQCVLDVGPRQLTIAKPKAAPPRSRVGR